MRIEAIVLDLDGTLLTSDRKISKKTKEILYKFKEKGTEIIIATGRTYKSLRKYKLALGIDTPVICFNGAKVVDGKTEETLFEYPVKEEEVKELIKISREMNIHLNLYQNEIWYVEHEGEESEIYKGISELDYEFKNFDTFNHYRMTKTLFVGENEKLKELEKVVDERLGKKINKAFSKPFFLEVFNKEVNKGETLRRLFELHNINIENVVAFGDGMNDLEMLQIVGKGVVMSNGSDELKKLINGDICGSNDEDGIGNYLEKYLEKEE